VCICIPNYNSEKTIAETIDSLINQTYKNIIIKVFDNNSTDDSMNILLRYSKEYSNIHVFKNDVNIGGEANFTKCIQNMEGDYGAIYHSDDIYMSTIVEEEVQALENNDISAVFTRTKSINEYSTIVNRIDQFPDNLSKELFYKCSFYDIFDLILKNGNFLATPSAMVRVELYKYNIKSWDSEKFDTSSDLDVWLRLSKIKDIGIITKKLLHYRVSSASFSTRRKFINVKDADFLKVLKLYLDKNPNFDKAYYEYHKLKDTNAIVRNKILNNLPVKSSDIVLFKIDLIKIILMDSKKVKIYSYSIINKIFLFFGMKQFLTKIIKNKHNL
jgi:glycosyltransferase involved in cell wall biosynthesis